MNELQLIHVLTGWLQNPLNWEAKAEQSGLNSLWLLILLVVSLPACCKNDYFHHLPGDIFWWLSLGPSCASGCTMASPLCAICSSTCPEDENQCGVQLLAFSFNYSIVLVERSCVCLKTHVPTLKAGYLTYLLKKAEAYRWQAGWGRHAFLIDFVRVFSLQCFIVVSLTSWRQLCL